MRGRSYLWLGAVVVTIAVALTGYVVARDRDSAGEPSGLPLPRSMAAIGDSITQAVAVDQDALGAAPEHSWATGTDADDVVSSHSERLIAAGALDGDVNNNSVPGAQVADAIEQAQASVEQRVDYVVILIGANDVCAADASAMTSVESFEGSFTSVMNTLTSGLPDSSIFVASILDIHRLWEVAGDNLAATTIWDAAGICRSALSGTISDEERSLAQTRNRELNEVLEKVCALHTRCRYDGGAVFDHEFSAEDVGPLDYFHPSLEGQADLANISWAEGFWPDV